MATRLPTGTRNAIVNAVVGLVDAGPSYGYIEIRTGTQPTTGNDTATGTVLSTVICQDPAFPSASSGSSALNGVPISDAADNSGTAGWFRILDSTGAKVADGMCSMAGGGGEMILDNTSLATGQTFTISSLTVSV